MCGGSGCQGSTVGRPRSGVALTAHYTTVEHNIRPREGDDLSQSALSGSRNGRFSGQFQVSSGVRSVAWSLGAHAAVVEDLVPGEFWSIRYADSCPDVFTELVKTAECRPATVAIRQRQRVKVGLLERCFLKS